MNGNNAMKKIHTLGNTLGNNKKSLNISQNFGDSSLNEFTLAKTGKANNLNLTSLLKSHLLDEDGIEDMHFYFVSFNQHKRSILKKHENASIIRMLTNKAHKRSQSQANAVNVKSNVMTA